KLPVYLVLGVKGAGKTNLLATGELIIKKSIPHLQTEEETHSDSAICHWHITEDAVYLEIPSDFVQAEIKPTSNNPWLVCLHYLNKYRHFLPIQGVIVVADFARLLVYKKQKRELITLLLKVRLLELRKLLRKALPLYILFTKCDSLLGFNDYFANLT